MIVARWSVPLPGLLPIMKEHVVIAGAPSV